MFGCSAFVYNAKPKSKFHSRASPGIYLGSNDHGVHTVELLTSGKIINSVNVTFDKSSFPKLDRSENSSSAEEAHGYDPDENNTSESDKDAFPDCSSSFSDESADDDAISVSE